MAGARSRSSRTPLTRPSTTAEWLLAAFICIWTGLAIAAWYRADWLLENIIVFVALPLFIRSARRWRFSDRAYACLFAFAPTWLNNAAISTGAIA